MENYNKPKHLHEATRYCSKNQMISSLHKMITILFVLTIIQLQLIHLTEKLSKTTEHEFVMVIYVYTNLYIYSYFNLHCQIKASSLQDKTEGEYGILIGVISVLVALC